MAGLVVSVPSNPSGSGPTRPTGPLEESPFEIVFNFGPGMRQNPAAIQAAQQAAAEWESYIADKVTLFIDLDLEILPATQLVQSSSESAAVPYAELKRSLELDARNEPKPSGAGSGSLDDSILHALPEPDELRFHLPPETELLFDTSTTQSGQASARFNVHRAQLKALGLLPPSDPGYLEPDAHIVVNKRQIGAFDLDGSNGIDSTTMDFRAFIVHEIGHALGFASSVGSTTSGPITPTVLDLFRFPSAIGRFDPLTVDQFTTFPRELRPTVATHTDFVLPFWGHSGPVQYGMAAGFSGYDTGHWEDVDEHQFVMDPVLPTGPAPGMSLADLRALDLIGWDVISPSAVPLIGSEDERRNPHDVDNNGQVTALDALLVVNVLKGEGEAIYDPMFDANEDNKVSAVDALVIVNYMSREQLEATSEPEFVLLHADPSEKDESVRELAVQDESLSLLF